MVIGTLEAGQQETYTHINTYKHACSTRYQVFTQNTEYERLPTI